MAQKMKTYDSRVAGAKRGGGGGRAKSIKEVGNPPPFFPYSLFPTPLDACYAG